MEFEHEMSGYKQDKIIPAPIYQGGHNKSVLHYYYFSGRYHQYYFSEKYL